MEISRWLHGLRRVFIVTHTLGARMQLQGDCMQETLWSLHPQSSSWLECNLQKVYSTYSANPTMPVLESREYIPLYPVVSPCAFDVPDTARLELYRHN
jgi:hypothetical protein